MSVLRRTVEVISVCSLLGACNGSQPDTADAAAGRGGTGGTVTGGGGDGGSAAGTTGTAGSAAGTTGTAGSTAGRGGGAAGSGVAGQGNAGGGAGQTATGLALFYSDLTSGPNKGGQDDNGAFVTVFGAGFGTSQGNSTVTVGGGVAAAYPIWTNAKITFQLGAAAATGSIVVHVDGKGDSNTLPFTVRAGNIYFVTSSGSDSNNGAFATPWKTIPKAKNTLAAGDIAYLGKSAGDTLSQTTEDPSASYRCALGMSANGGANSGTANAPKALVAYPGAQVTIGATSGLQRGILTPQITGTFDYWVISQLSLRGETEAIDIEAGAAGWRIIGNDISCPNGAGLSGCVVGGLANNTPGLKFLGNVVHDAAANVTTVSKYYHAIYFQSDNLEIGWNTVRDGKTCRGILFHDSDGPNEYGLSVHDNLIHGTVCDGLEFGTVDPSQGPVVAYNNVIYDVGLGPDPADGSSNYTCIYIANITNQGAAGSGKVQLYNNTLYNCGPRGTGSAGGIGLASGPVSVQMDNNLIFALSGQTYISGDSGSAPKITGSNNLLFGGTGTAPTYLTGNILRDPLLVGAASHDFHLTSASPAVDAGKATGATTDFDGRPRPQGTTFDIGAYELAK